MKEYKMRNAGLFALSLAMPVWAMAAEPERIAHTTNEAELITSEVFHKLTLQGGYGPEDSLLGADEDRFYSIRYEPTFIWYEPEKRWPRWMVFTRGWLAYDSGNSSSPLREDDQQQVDGFNAELREFYLRRSLFNDDPALSLTLGRQRFADRSGLWWDDTFEALRLDYTGAFTRGFVAAGQKFFNYNTDVNSLDPRDKDIIHVLGQYGWHWRHAQWAGLKFMYSDDHSGDNPEDPSDFTGYRLGAFMHGSTVNENASSDYRLEVAMVNGERELQNSTSDTTAVDVQGWAVQGEFGLQLQQYAWQPRIALYAGMTDTPDEDDNGFFLNRIQSDRLINDRTYSTRLVSSAFRVDMRNLLYYGAGVELHPTERSILELRVSDMQLRNAAGPLPLRTDSPRNTDSQSLGQVIDLNYYWQNFPLAYRGRLFNLNTLASASYLSPGDATPDLDDQYQISLGIIMHY